jgi:DNA-binding NtrC family response regulator
MMSQVLIVHREAVPRHFLSTFFEHEGCEVVQCTTSEDASHILDAPNSIHVMFVDLDMSDQNGSEDSPLFRHVHNAQLAGIPFVGMSARLSQGDGERMVGRLGGQAFISLPVEPTILRMSLAQILQRDSGPDSPHVVVIGQHREWIAAQAKIFQQQEWSVEECHRPSEVRSRIFAHSPDLFVVHHPVLGNTSSGWLVDLKHHASHGRVFVAAADYESQLALELLQYDAQGFKRQPPDQSYFDRLFANAERNAMGVSLSPDGCYGTVEPRGFSADFQTFLHDFDEIIMMIDDEGVIVDINAYGSQILEWPAQDICGHTLRMLEPSGTVEWLASVQNSRWDIH